MIIHQPQLEIKEGYAYLSARVESKQPTPLPKHLWFRYPEAYAAALSTRADGFYTSLFLLAMHLNENLQVRGEVSPLLAKNIQSYSHYFLQQEPQKYSPLQADLQQLSSPAPQSQPAMRLMSFSGGVDSFFGLWSSQCPELSPYPIHFTHGLFIHGFDLLLQKTATYKLRYEKLNKVFQQFGLELIEAGTNAYSFYQFRIPWTNGLITTLGGAAYGLSNAASHFYQPSNYEPNPENPKSLSTRITLLSNETLQFEVHAPPYDRAKKLALMVDWKPIHHNLMVCIKPDAKTGEILCQKCEKCINTQFILHLLGKQNEYPDFRKPFTLKRFLRLLWKTKDSRVYTKRSYMQLMKEGNHYGYIILFTLQLPFNWVKTLLAKEIVPRLPKAFLRNIKQKVYTHQQTEKNDDWPIA